LLTLLAIGTSSAPSFGQSKTSRKSFPGFWVHLPQASFLKGLAVVP